MLVAAIYDIHGNLPALEAVLDEIRQAGADRIVVGGDVLPGPMPRETIARLMNLDVPAHFIRGNGDREVMAAMQGRENASLPEPARQSIRWVAQQLDAAHEKLLASWPETLRLPIKDGPDVLFCHATPRNDTDVFTQLTPEERLAPIFEGLSASDVICGHTHMQFQRFVGKVRVSNAGSVGMPFGDPGAYWLLVGREVEFRRTQYDFEAAAERIGQTNYSGAEDFATRNVLRPPSQAEMLKVFARAELS